MFRRLVERPPWFYRILFPHALWRVKGCGRTLFLTFDDGPIPEVTPWLLDLLDQYAVKATFFCVGDNVRKHPALYQEILHRGHAVGNHTFNHLQGWKVRTHTYIQNTRLAQQYIDSRLFRPPYGHLRLPQGIFLRRNFRVVMWDVITRDYNRKLTGEEVFRIVRRNARPGSIFVFHDSIKAKDRLVEALPRSIEWLQGQGYAFDTLRNF